MTLTTALILSALGFLFYLLIFHAPKSDRIFVSSSADELVRIREYLEKNGVSTYTKNQLVNELRDPGLSMNDLGFPSLHVTDPRQVQLAQQLIRDFQVSRKSDS